MILLVHRGWRCWKAVITAASMAPVSFIETMILITAGIRLIRRRKGTVSFRTFFILSDLSIRGLDNLTESIFWGESISSVSKL